LGGIQTLFGAILGTAILKILDLVLSGITQRYLLIMGILFLITIMFAPRGAAGALMRLWDRVASRTLGSGPPAKGATDDQFYKDTN
jgi:ABC-type branched-subunit amino acid transport system permease subunit